MKKMKADKKDCSNGDPAPVSATEIHGSVYDEKLETCHRNKGPEKSTW